MIPFFESPGYQEATARLDYALERRDPVALLSGPRGSGKTTLLEHWSRKLRRAGLLVALLRTPGTFEHDFLWELCVQLKAEAGIGSTPTQLWFHLREQLAAYRLEERPVAILVDHAEEMAPETADVLLTLARLHSGDSGHASLVLAIDHQHLSRLDPRLYHLAALKIELEPWNVADTSRYVDAYRQANPDSLQTVSDETVQTLAECADGNPQLISRILDLSRMAVTQEETGSFSPQEVRALREELL